MHWATITFFYLLALFKLIVLKYNYTAIAINSTLYVHPWTDLP